MNADFERPQFELTAFRPLVPSLRSLTFVFPASLWDTYTMWEFTKDEFFELVEGGH
jgi:hypothetical protein